jgi:hypothetical protein
MTWNTRTEYLRLVGGSQTPLADKLTQLGFGPTAPAREIIRTPTNLELRFRDRTIHASQLLRDLMANYWTYGRSHWSWTASSTGGAVDGGLVKGAVNFGACGTFNDGFAHLATRVLGIEGVKKGNAEENMGITWYKGNFVTMPVDVIDSKWTGGVMSHNYAFSALKMYKFSDHYFCNYEGVIFDATGNATHQTTKTLVAFDLQKLSAEASAPYNAANAEVFEVKNVSENFVTKPELNVNEGRWVVISLGSDTLVAAGANRAFNKYLLTKQTKTGKSEIENFQLISGRTSKTAYV